MLQLCFVRTKVVVSKSKTLGLNKKYEKKSCTQIFLKIFSLPSPTKKKCN